jgi:hypothetical protein
VLVLVIEKRIEDENEQEHENDEDDGDIVSVIQKDFAIRRLT